MGISFHTKVMKCFFKQLLRIFSYTGRQAREDNSSMPSLWRARSESGERCTCC